MKTSPYLWGFAVVAALGLVGVSAKQAEAGGPRVYASPHGGLSIQFHLGRSGSHHGLHFAPGRPGPGHHRRGHYDWHDTSHYDWHPGHYRRHGNHYHYLPGHYDFHREGHWDFHRGGHRSHHGHHRRH